MREISPARNLTANEYFDVVATAKVREFISKIRQQKALGTRPIPSSALIDRSSVLTPENRRTLLDAVAALVDENLTGRSDMCLQFAELLCLGLKHLNLPARWTTGTAIYFEPSGRKIWEWPHAWVRVGAEVIDGNTDILFENPAVPPTVTAFPYWGPIHETPRDRKLREKNKRHLDSDEDVTTIWWPEFRAWIDRSICPSP